MTPTLLVISSVLAVIGFVAGLIDAHSRYAYLIALLTGLAFYPVLELLYLQDRVPWTPLITQHQEFLAKLNAEVLIGALLVPYFAGRLVVRLGLA